MKVSQLFENLAMAELSNLAIADNGVLADKAHQRILRYTDEALLALFTRFPLKTRNLIIEMQEHITKYHLAQKFAECSQSNEPFKYIKDLPEEPFKDDALKILEVWDSQNRKRPLNDPEHEHSVFTPQPTTLEVPIPLHGKALAVTYQARHPSLVRETEYINQHIDIPVYLESALQNYIGSKVYSHMNGQENKITSQEFMMNYENSCLGVITEDMVNATNHTSHMKLEKRGFV